MFLDWDFASLMLPVVITFAVCFAAGAWVWERFAPSKVASIISNTFFFVGIGFLAVAAAAIVLNLVGPPALGVYCSFATC